jgi:hypothetical protein
MKSAWRRELEAWQDINREFQLGNIVSIDVRGDLNRVGYYILLLLVAAIGLHSDEAESVSR